MAGSGVDLSVYAAQTGKADAVGLALLGSGLVKVKSDRYRVRSRSGLIDPAVTSATFIGFGENRVALWSTYFG